VRKFYIFHPQYVLRGKNKFLSGIKVHKMYGIPNLRVHSHSMTVMPFLHTRFEVFKAVTLNIFISRNEMICTLAEVY